MRENDENNNNITILHRVIEEDLTVHLKKTAKRKLFKDSSETNVKRANADDVLLLWFLSVFESEPNQNYV